MLPLGIFPQVIYLKLLMEMSLILLHIIKFLDMLLVPLFHQKFILRVLMMMILLQDILLALVNLGVRI